MFDIVLKPEAEKDLRRLKRYHARQIMDAMDRHLRHEPDRTSSTTIKRLRGKQSTAYRLRVGEYRIFYDVHESSVQVARILHKEETAEFYLPGEPR
jgi:mRNA-degrading endonuclease RelE of RelBE toxin-antitoxin system